MKRMISRNAQDSIPHEDYFALSREDGMVQASFFAFNTVIDLAAFGGEDIVEHAMRAACDLCRHYERLFSRTLPHSDVSRVNSAAGRATEVDRETFDVVCMALDYCAASEGTFDVTIGPAVRLWNFHEHTRPNPDELARAMEHVGWPMSKSSIAGRCWTGKKAGESGRAKQKRLFSGKETRRWQKSAGK